MSTFEYILSIAFLALGAGFQACVGIGMAMVAGPVLVAMDSSVLPDPLLVLATAVNIRNAILDSEYIDLLG